MLKVNVGLNRKSWRDSNSTGFSLNLEGEICGTLDDPETVIERIKEYYDLADEALRQQIERYEGDAAIASRDEQPVVPPKCEARPEPQPTCYVHAIAAAFGRAATVEYAVLVKTKTPKLQRLKTARYDEDSGRLGDMIQTVERAIQLNVFYPVESPLNCSTCPHRQPCRDWGRNGKPV